MVEARRDSQCPSALPGMSLVDNLFHHKQMIQKGVIRMSKLDITRFTDGPNLRVTGFIIVKRHIDRFRV